MKLGIEGAEATGKEVDAAKKDEKGKDGSAEKKPDEKNPLKNLLKKK